MPRYVLSIAFILLICARLPVHAADVDAEAAKKAFQECFFPTGEETIAKYSIRKIGIYMEGRPKLQEYVKEKLDYYSNFLGGTSIDVRNWDVHVIFVFSENMFRDAILYYDKMYAHIEPDKSEVFDLLMHVAESGGKTVALFSFEENERRFATVLVQVGTDDDDVFATIDASLISVLFMSRTEGSHRTKSAIEDKKCSRMLDPDDAIGRWMGQAFNSDLIKPGMTAGQVNEVLQRSFEP